MSSPTTEKDPGEYKQTLQGSHDTNMNVFLRVVAEIYPFDKL